MPARLLRLLPVDGWSLAILFWTLAFGFVMRTWRIVEYLRGSYTADWSDLQWVPKSAGVDVGFALIVWLLCGALLWPFRDAENYKKYTCRFGALLVVGWVLFFGCANALSFRLTGSALTLHRLRGDDGATMRDWRSIEWGDMGPVFLLTALSIAALVVLLLVLAPRIDRWSLAARHRVALTAVVVGVLSLSAYELLWKGRDQGYGRHPTGVFIESYIEAHYTTPDSVKSFVAPKETQEGWERLFTPDAPTTPPPPTPTLASTEPVKNVIVFFSEGVPLKHTSLHPDGPPTTPRLKARAAQEGLEMTRFYSPFHKSIQAIFALFCGTFPTPNGKSISELNPRIDCGELSEVMKKNDVHAGLFHGGYFSFYDKTSFLAGRGFEVELDAPALREQAPKRKDGQPWLENSWGIDDRATVGAMLDWIDTVPKDERFAAVLVPITAHYPYEVPDDVTPPFGDERKIDKYLRSVYFLDVVFDEMMKGLEQRGLLDDTLVLFLADHGESPNEPPRETHVDRAMYEHNVHIPFVMFNKKLFPTAQKSDRLSSIVDIIPTVLDAMELPDPKPRQGQSFLSPDWEERRVFFGAARSNVLQVGFIDGTRKFAFDLRKGRTELYDLATDPLELRDLSRSNKDFVAKGRDLVLTFNKWQYAHVRDMPTIGEETNAQELLANDFDVFVVDKDGNRLPCARTGTGTARACPGQGPDFFTGVIPAKVASRDRLCLGMQLPPGGARLELTAKDRDYFRFVTTMRAAFGIGSKTTDAVVDVTLQVDDEEEKTHKVSKNYRHRRFLFGAPREKLTVKVSSTSQTLPLLCLFFGDAPWRPRQSVLEAHGWVAPADGDDDDHNVDPEEKEAK